MPEHFHFFFLTHNFTIQIAAAEQRDQMFEKCLHWYRAFINENSRNRKSLFIVRRMLLNALSQYLYISSSKWLRCSIEDRFCRSQIVCRKSDILFSFWKIHFMNTNTLISMTKANNSIVQQKKNTLSIVRAENRIVLHFFQHVLFKNSI